jgi:hypothetical protein
MRFGHLWRARGGAPATEEPRARSSPSRVNSAAVRGGKCTVLGQPRHKTREAGLWRSLPSCCLPRRSSLVVRKSWHSSACDAMWNPWGASGGAQLLHSRSMVAVSNRDCYSLLDKQIHQGVGVGDFSIKTVGLTKLRPGLCVRVRRELGSLPMRCVFCDRPLEIKSAWKGVRDRFYCSEFCADSEMSEATPAQNPASLLQYHLDRPYERLERLLPYMRRYS